MSLQISQGARYARILGVGAATGNRVVTNEELCQVIDSSDEWIQQRTGIITRRWVDDSQDAKSLALTASQEAIAKSGLTASDIDAILVATISNPRATPSLSATLAGELGLHNPAAMDLGAACAGFCYGLSLADSMVRTGTARNVLVVGVEVLSRLTNMTDRGTTFLFGDAAGAVVVGPSETPAIGPVVWGSDGAQSEVITTDDWGEAVAKGYYPSIAMEGNKVFKWAITDIAATSREALAKANISSEELDVFIPHQANERIITSMLRYLGLPESVKVSRQIRTLGNTSAASIPLAMAEMLATGEAKSGDLALLIGFGAGLVYAGQVVVLP